MAARIYASQAAEAIDRDADSATALMDAHLRATEQAVMRFLAGT
jgi:hypothetical protein